LAYGVAVRVEVPRGKVVVVEVHTHHRPGRPNIAVRRLRAEVRVAA
jgi:hypothetical protein